jgi:spermidine dehydrogenase
MTGEDDKRLGMDRPIGRRDFLNGSAAIVGGALVSSGQAWAAATSPGEDQPATPDQPGYYPPTRTGLRGSHPGSFEAAHALRDGTFDLSPGRITGDEEKYDLIIVGGGISGLSAAWFFRERRPDARILILENHDDFGGHAKRNEFELGGKLALLNGGTLEIDSPRPYSVIAGELLRKLGINPARLEAVCAKPGFYKSLGLQQGYFFDRETFGADRLVVAAKGRKWAEILADAPLSAQAKADVARLYEGKTDYMPGLSSDEKKAKLARISYRDYLLNVVKVDPGVIPMFQAATHGEWGVGIDAVGALEVWAFDYPGFEGLKLAPGPAPHMGVTASGYALGGSEKFHFPDGNASIARLLVRSLVPGCIPGKSAEDVVTAHADYSLLDRPGSRVRIRLNSLAVHARNLGDGKAPHGVEVTYATGGKLHVAEAGLCVLAGWNMMIPYLCPEMSERQKEALHYLVKTPLVYTSVALRNWRAFAKLGIHRVEAPGSYFSYFGLNPTVDIGDYKSPRSPDEPILVHLVRTPCKPGLEEREQNRAGRAELLATPFEIFERNIRDQLGRTLGPGGFDPADDITAITVNRWPHGYAYEYNPLFDPDWTEQEQPHVIGRTPFGRITIANSDSGAQAYTDSAINQAHRAVEEALAIDG